MAIPNNSKEAIRKLVEKSRPKRTLKEVDFNDLRARYDASRRVSKEIQRKKEEPSR